MCDVKDCYCTLKPCFGVGTEQRLGTAGRPHDPRGWPEEENTPFTAHVSDGESAFSSRPDLIIFSDKLKHILYIELTSPWEGPRMEESHKKKMEKYRTAGLHSIPGWSTTPLCVEVGVRGTTSNTFHRMCKALGMSSRESKRLGKKARTVAARCSYFIFLSRKVTDWDPRRPYVRC